MLASLAACGSEKTAHTASDEGEATHISLRKCVRPTVAVYLKPGTFSMGQDALYPEEGPVRDVRLAGFWIDTTEVTNRQFARFVEATGYRTIAEKPVDPAAFTVPVEQIPPAMLEAGSAVFISPAQPSSRYFDWWHYVPGANWRKPFGPEGEDFNPNVPVVHLGYDDMRAYAAWRGGRLPTEAEWEYAARAGSANTTEQPVEANSWQGVFPIKNLAEDGFKGLAPVGCYAPNAWGLYDMIGNAWEMTNDFYAPSHDPERPQENPRGPSENTAYDPSNPSFSSRVVKGGSYLCAPNYCRRYRPAARTGRDPSMGASNVGFRLVYDSKKAAKPVS